MKAMLFALGLNELLDRALIVSFNLSTASYFLLLHKIAYVNFLTMKRLLLGLIIAVITFSIGNMLTLRIVTYNIRVRAQQEAERSRADFVLRESISEDLLLKLRRIDERFNQRCQLYIDYGSKWSEVISLERLRDCNDEWAKARREAINSELNKNLITY